MLIPTLAAFTLAAIQPQPLAGPTVPPSTPRTSLISYDLDGRLRPLDACPDLAAVELLKLPPDLQSKVDAITAAHAAAIDRFVTSNLMLLSQLDSASKAGDKLDQAILLMEGFDKLRPALEPGPLRDQIRRVLPHEYAQRFCALRDEYWRAVVNQALRDNRAAGKHDARWAVDLGARFQELGQEVARSFQRQSDSGTLFVDYLLADLDLTPAQQDTVRALKLDMLARTSAKPTEEDQKRLGLGILAYLNPAQRLAVIKKIPK